jgi:hypothetical protein
MFYKIPSHALNRRGVICAAGSVVDYQLGEVRHENAYDVCGLLSLPFVVILPR